MVLKPTKETFTTADGNVVEYELYTPKKKNGKVIIYCHGGFGHSLTPDVQFYPQFGFSLAHLNYEGDENGFSPSANDPIRDVTEISDLAYKLSWGYIGGVYLLGVSRGGYSASLAFGHSPGLFKKLVNMMGPINMQDPKYPYDWSVWGTTPGKKAVIDDAKKFFAKTPDPYSMAKAGKFNGLGDRIFMIYGEKDDICPPASMYVPFKKLVKCKGMIMPKLWHSVHRDPNAQIAATIFFKQG